MQRSLRVLKHTSVEKYGKRSATEKRATLIAQHSIFNDFAECL